MARRRHVDPEPVTQVVPDQLRRRYSQLARRFRLAFTFESPEYRRVAARVATLREQTDDPAQSLSDLLDLADEVRPLLSAGAREYTLPDSFNRWRRP